MERHERDFKGVWIPREIWLSNELSLMEKVLFVEIHSLDNERGCFASNAYFAEFFAVSVRQIATYIASLKKKGYIESTLVNGFERTIHVTGKFAYPNANERRKLRMNMERLADGMRYDTRRGVGDNRAGARSIPPSTSHLRAHHRNQSSHSAELSRHPALSLL